MLVIGGIPLFYMELALGQYVRKGAITCWGRVCPLFKGIGICVVMIAFFTDLFYNVIIAWSLYYLFASFSPSLPWTSCNNTWNIAATCYDEHIREKLPSTKTADAAKLIDNDQIGGLLGTENASSSLARRSYRRMSTFNGNFGIDNIGSIQWKLAVCLALVVWFTAIFPYCVLLIFLIRGVTLEGSMMGIYYYMYPNLSELLNSKPWIDAATQVFFSLDRLWSSAGVRFRRADHKCSKLHDEFFVRVRGICNHRVPGSQTEGGHQGLVFTVYPEALATLPGSTFWSLCFFLMLMTLGLDSSALI
uniref:Sodium-dependent serotonin transporter n=1 Tax=Macrostomum lignano TaxID=282301 RepID=A0A1I8IXA3_9PLAT